MAVSVQGALAEAAGGALEGLGAPQSATSRQGPLLPALPAQGLGGEPGVSCSPPPTPRSLRENADLPRAGHFFQWPTTPLASLHFDSGQFPSSVPTEFQNQRVKLQETSTTLRSGSPGHNSRRPTLPSLLPPLPILKGPWPWPGPAFGLFLFLRPSL